MRIIRFGDSKITMRLFNGQFMAFVFGIAGRPSTAVNKYDGFIGCYEYGNGTEVNTTTIPKNSGSACKEHCSPRYRYAGIQLNECYCGDSPIGIRVEENLCVFPCGDFMAEKCGGSFKLTMYEVMEIDTLTTTNDPMTSATSTTSTKPTTSDIMKDSISTNVTETGKLTTTNDPMTSATSTTTTKPTTSEDVPWSYNILWCISIPVVFVIAHIIVRLILLYRCKKKRKPHTCITSYEERILTTDLM